VEPSGHAARGAAHADQRMASASGFKRDRSKWLAYLADSSARTR
jgi:hypothetical protein